MVLSQYRIDSDIAKLMRRRAGDYVKSLRIDAGLTQAQIAKALGYEYYTMISQIESGKARIPSEDIEHWARLLKVDKSAFAKKLLSFLDPNLYHAIFGGEHPVARESKRADSAPRHKRTD